MLLGRSIRHAAIAAAFVAVAATTEDAWALDVELSGTTAAQGYAVASPWGYDLERRRLLQTVGFSLYHLQGDYVPGKEDYNVRLMFRIDAEFGLGNHLASDISGAETDFSLAGGRHYVPGLTPARLDVMYAYVEGKGLADGWFGFRAGRQYVTDALGWWSFDGGLLRLSTPAFFDVEAYGGIEQRGGIPLSSSRFESQGVWRGARNDFDEPGGPRSSDYPSYQFASPAPAFGGALQTNGPNWLHGRVSYRRVYNTGEAFTQQFPDSGGGYRTVDGLRLSSEKVGFAGDVTIAEVVAIKGGLSYDLYNQLFPTAFGGIEAYLGDRVTIGLDGDHFNPTYDADSIFNWFTHGPNTTATGRIAARFTDDIDMSAQGGARLWQTSGDPDAFGEAQCVAAGLASDCREQGVVFDSTGLAGESAILAASRDEENRKTTYTVDGLGQLGARYRTTTGSLELRGMAQLGGRGKRVGGDIGGEKLLDGGRYALGAKASLYDFTNRIGEDTPSFGYVLGLGFKPIDVTRLGLEWEHDINELAGQRFRVLARLDILWVK